MKKVVSILIIVVLILAILLCYFKFNLKVSPIENRDLDIQAEKSKENINIQIEDFDIRANIPIFMYHWVREDTGGYEYPENMAKPSELRKQMEYLKENNYDVIWVTDLDGLQHYDKPVILTFDDGWMDVYREAFPLAKEFNMKICMYVITDLVGTESYCTVDQLKEMRDSGLVQIDSHTLSHPYLDTLSEEEVNAELVDSKKWLKDNLNIDSKVICYPSGRRNKIVSGIAEKNYDYGLLMDGNNFEYNSLTSDLYGITRIYARRSMTLESFKNFCQKSYVKVN